MTETIRDPRELRNALGAFVTGVTVITTREHSGNPRGFTANSFTSVSLDPPLILACIANSASSYPVFSEREHFAVNILAESQKDVSGVFASKRADKFDQVDWREEKTGSPIIAGAASWLDCTVHDRIPSGDHLILIGRVVSFGYTTDTPLGYCRGAYLNYTLEQAAIPDPGQAMHVGAILEQDGQIPFQVDADSGALSLPTGPRIGHADDRDSLLARLKKLGIEGDLNFIYAVFEDANNDLQVYYRGQVSAAASTAEPIEWAALSEIPWSRISDDAVRSMLERYVRERTSETFGIYVGGPSQGEIQQLAQPV